MRSRSLVPLALAVLALSGGPGTASDSPIDLGHHRGVESSIEGLQARLYRAVPTTPDEIDRLQRLIGDLEKRIEGSGLDRARTTAVRDDLAEYRRSARNCLVRWSVDCTLLAYRRRWEMIRSKHFVSDAPQPQSSAELDAAQRRRIPDVEDDLLERLDFVEHEYSDLLDYASQLDVTGCRGDPSFNHETIWWAKRIKRRLWRPLVPLSTPPRALGKARQVFEETRPVIQALLTTPWCDTFVQAARREIPLEQRRIRTARQRLLAENP